MLIYDRFNEFKKQINFYTFKRFSVLRFFIRPARVWFVLNIFISKFCTETIQRHAISDNSEQKRKCLFKSFPKLAFCLDSLQALLTEFLKN